MVALRTVYADASALVKLVVTEPESVELRDFMAGARDVVTSRISVVEVARAVARRDDLVVTGLDAVIRSVSIRELDESLATLAAAIRPPSLRTLDAMHLASALSVGATLDAFVTYDGRLADTARLHALPVVTPGS